jgi:carbon monoxide dehydrogenase subunit G
LKVTIDRTFPLPGPPEIAWEALSDIEALASCMPGSRITERVDERHFKGTVMLKVGPATLTFNGEIEVQRHDAATRTLELLAKGTDTSGSSAASLSLRARIEDADGGRSRLIGNSEASVSGKAATFGGRMMDAVADQILKQFAANFASRVGASAIAQAAIDKRASLPFETREEETSTRAQPPKIAEGPPLNGIAIVLAIVKQWLRRVFSGSKA